MGGTELEDGRACYCKDDTSIDPDIALSYIDEKLQNVLGHFQKDFEGGVSAENLGAMFGGYGSFLPTYQRSPSVRSHPKTPQSAHNYSTPRSPNYMLSESAPQSSTVPASHSVWPTPASHGNHLYPNVASADASNKRKPCMMPVQSVEEGSSTYNPSAVRLVNPTDQKSLKVRLRVNCNRTRNNAAIYSGLGLVSPSSSIGNSLDESGGMPTGSQETPYRSPSSILHDMTSFPVPGDLLLSPLDENLLCLITKEKLLSERKLVLPIKGRQKNSSKSVDFSSSVLWDEKLLKENNTRPVDKHEAVEKNVNAVEKFDDKTDFLAKNDEQTEMLESKQLWTTNLKFKMPSNSLHDADNYLNVAVIDPEGSRKTKLDVPMKKRGMKKHLVEDKLFPIDLANKDSSESISGQGNSKTVQKEIKSSSMEQTTQRDSRKSRGVVTIKSSRVSSLSKADSHASKHKKDSVSFNMDHHEKVYSSTATSHELMLHDIELENKSKRSESIPKVASELPEEKMRPGGWAVMRDKKNVQSDVCKVRDTNKGALDIGSDNMEDQMKSLKMPDRGKGHDHEAVRTQEAPTEAVSAHIELASAAPMGGEDHWVCCDLCEKWRLLPYGVEPEQFPEKWLCSMLYWLPGMNHCEVEEDVTTAAVRALPQYPVPQFQDNLQNHADKAISGVTSVDGHLNNNQNLNFDAMPYPGKKKTKSKPSSSSSVPIQISHKSVNAQEDALNCITCNFPVERQETKLKGKHANSGDMKSKKLKSKRESDEYNYRSLKKARLNDKYWISEHAGDVGPTMSVGKGIEKHCEQLSSAKDNPPPSGKLVNSVNKQRDSTQSSTKSVSLNRKTCDERELHAKKRKLKDWQDSQTCIVLLGGNGSDLPQNKIIEDSGSRRLRKEKKLRMSTTALKKSNVDDRPVKKGTVENIFISASRDNLVGRSHEKDRKKVGQRGSFASQPTLNAPNSSKMDLGTERFPLVATSSSSKVSDSHRRVSLLEIRGSPVESVSSSPTRLYKQGRLSPSGQGVSTKDVVRNCDVLTVSPRRKSLDLEITFESNQSGMSRNVETYGFLHTQSSGLHVQHCGASDTSHRFDGKAEPSTRHSSHMSNHGADMSTGQRQGRISMQSSDHGDSEGRLNIELHTNGVEFPKKPIRGSPTRSNNDRNLGFQRVKLKISDPLIERELIPEKMQRTEVDSCKPASHSEELTEHRKRFSIKCNAKSNDHKKSVDTKDSGRWENGSREEKPIKLAERVGLRVKFGVVGDEGGRITLKKEMVAESESEVSKKRDADHIRSRGGKLESNPHHANNLEESALVPQQLLGTQEGNGIGVRTLNGTADYKFSNGLKQPGNALHQNGAHSTLESVVSDQCTVKILKESSSTKETSCQTATSVLKRAEKFKKDANRYKEAGFHVECNEANFQAALQFLCSASLQEASSSECSKQGEMNPVQIYITAAKLLQNCAHEFEKQKEMAAAALAYKCMEVAYMKVVYCQSSTINRDRHDLQATLQMVTQGESPSSSASDVDNLNNQAIMDKAAFSRGIVHAGNHIIVARSRTNLSRVFDFTRDVSLAMEASRKSRSAYTAAKVTLEEAQNKEGIISVEKVMDFSFHDVEELVRLVNHAANVFDRHIEQSLRKLRNIILCILQQTLQGRGTCSGAEIISHVGDIA